MTRRWLLACILGLLVCGAAQKFPAQTLPSSQTLPAAQTDESAIRQVMADQVAAWNRADIDGFMAGYKNSPDTTFVGKTVQHGWQTVLERYKHSYPTKESMGTLDFSELDVRMIGPGHATVTGRFHLARSAAGGGDAAGVFSLVWEKSAEGWKIILDHTS